MRYLLTVAILMLATACATAPLPSMPEANLDSAQGEPPDRETASTTPTSQLNWDRGNAVPENAHVRFEAQGGVFLDNDVDDVLDSTWGAAASMGFFVHDHFSVGGMIDWLYASDDSDGVDTDLSMLTVAPMGWIHLTSRKDVAAKGTPNLALGVGPTFTWASTEVKANTPFGRIREDDDDTGFGFQVEAVGEIPVTNTFAITGGVRYTLRAMDDFDVDLDTFVGFFGLGIRF